jgi:hypothetical protein
MQAAMILPTRHLMKLLLRLMILFNRVFWRGRSCDFYSGRSILRTTASLRLLNSHHSDEAAESHWGDQRLESGLNPQV